ncbi:WG repeat-containing protein [Roseofilum capinflatum]|uniref:WG repeat-containing protein n=1 Tax=Roseofilum capinflatum BLCC-M114 TaxID=3022440 RepID=A0ABT7BA42_9CYAN|nr:WG repeat-containing protein [Roseofilum capinflatum]MDJ1175687.1 WG repeat-containing protein [Roseofilum capinflatum BLCC-M114]
MVFWLKQSPLRGFWAIATLTYLISGSPVSAFPDTQNYWASDCIERLSSGRGWVGYPDGTFRPNASITRAEFATMMINAFRTHSFSEREAITFKDVPSSHWAYQTIKRSYELQFFSGYPDRTFRPNQPITRTEAFVVLQSASDFTAPEEIEAFLNQVFDDVEAIPNYAKEAIANAAIGRLILNYPQVRQLRPTEPATRGEMAATFCQVLTISRTLPQAYIAVGEDPFDLPPELGGISEFSEGLAVFRGPNFKMGYMNPQGEIVIPAQYDYASIFEDGIARVRTGSLWQVITPEGKVTLEQNGYIPQFSEGLVRLGRSYPYTAIYNRDGEFMFEIDHFIDEFSDGLALVKLQERGGYGFVDRTGAYVIDPQPYEVSSFSEGRAWILQETEPGKPRYGFIDKTGKIVIEPVYEEVKAFSEGLAAVKVGGLWGYIDRSGTMVIEPQFQQAQPFSEGLAGVQGDSTWGYINPEGTWMIEGGFHVPEFAQIQPIEPFENGLAIARIGDRAGVKDRQANWVLPVEFVDIAGVSDGLAFVNVGGRWTTEVTGTNIPPDYPRRSVMTGGRWGYSSLRYKINEEF